MKYYTVDDLCHKFDKNRNYFSNLRQAGVLVGVKLGNKYYYTEKELREMFEDYQGQDLSNYDMMCISKRIVDRKKGVL